MDRISDKIAQNAQPCLKTATAPANQDLDIVFLNYMGSNVTSPLNNDATLGSFRELEQIKKIAPFTENKKIAFFIQGYEKRADGRYDTKRYYIQNGKTIDETLNIDGTKNVYENGHLENGIIKKEKCTGDDVTQFDMATLEDFLNDGYSKFPSAKEYYLILSTHGGGFKGIGGEAIINDKLYCGMENVVEKMPLLEVRDAIKKVEERFGKKISLINFNACLMGAVEVMLALKDTTEYIVASPEVEAESFLVKDKTQTNFQATSPVYLACLENSELMTSEKFGSLVIDKTAENTSVADYSEVPTLGLYSMKEVSDFDLLLGELGEKLTKALEDSSLREMIFNAINITFSYYEKDYKDFMGFLTKLNEKGIFDLCNCQNLKDKLKLIMNKMTVYMFRGKSNDKDYTKSGPLSLYIPAIFTEEGIKKEISLATNPLIMNLDNELAMMLMFYKPNKKYDAEQKRTLLDKIDFVKKIIDEEYMGRLKNIEGGKNFIDLLEKYYNLFNSTNVFKNENTIPDHDVEEILKAVSSLKENLKKVDIEGFIKNYYENAKFEEKSTEFLEKSKEKIDTDLEKYKKVKILPEGWIKFIEKIAEINKEILNKTLLPS